MTVKMTQIKQAIADALTNLPITGGNEFVGWGYDIPADRIPALRVRWGSATPTQVPAQDFGFVDSKFDFSVSVVSELDEYIDALAADVYEALVADRTLGLTGIVSTLYWTGNEPVNNEHAGDIPVESMQMNWTLKFRHPTSTPR